MNIYDIVEISCTEINNTCPPIIITEAGAGLYKAVVNLKLKTDIQMDDWCVSVSPRFVPEFHYSTHLTPEEDDVVDMHVFRSPAMIMQDKKVSVAVMPDLGMNFAEDNLRYYMDLDARNNKMTLGVSLNRIYQHVLYKKIPGAVIPAGFQYSFYILIQTEVSDLMNPFRKIGCFFWETYGRKAYDSVLPKCELLPVYVQRTYDWAFRNWSDVLWQQFDLNGITVGAPAFIVTVFQSPNFKGDKRERETRSVWNQAWFSSLRSASGLYRYARKHGLDELLKKALMTKELALNTPMYDGIFPSVVFTKMDEYMYNGEKRYRSAGWDTLEWGNSNRNPYTWDLSRSPYHVLDMSFTALLMLTWYQELEQDERLLQFASRYAERLLTFQNESGFFPCWINDNFIPCDILDNSPETAMSASFLFKMYEITKNRKYLESGLKAINAVVRCCVNTGRWEDFETYWSCCRYGSQSLVGRKVPRNNMYKQNTLSIYYTADALYNAYTVTGEQRYLDIGERCIDELLMAQSAWQPPYMMIPVIGGFGVMNCDGELNDSRQSLFAELIIRYGRQLDRPELVERGLCALRASFTMMYCPENPVVKKLWEQRWPHLNELDYGFMMENYGHGGY